MMGQVRGRAALGLLVVLLVVPGCASDNKTGDKNVLNFKDTVQGRLGESSTSPSATRTAAAGPVKTARAAVAASPTPRRTASTVRTQSAAPFVISINSD